MAYGWIRPSKLRLPDNTAVLNKSRSMISCSISGSSAPLIPLQVVQAKATTSKPSFCSSGNKLASSKYSLTAFEPGASDDLTQGLRIRPFSTALRATIPAATMLRGFEVLVQLVIAAMITAPSGISPSFGSGSFSFSPCAIPSLTRSVVDTRACGREGPAILRTTFDKSKCSTRSYSASFRPSAHRPTCLA